MRLRLPLARIASVLLFAALCAIVAAWALQLLAPRAPIAPAGAIAQGQQALDPAVAAQLFGGVPRATDTTVAAAPSNIQVAGVVAAGARGVALIVVDGKPARPYGIGETVADGLKVRSVRGDTVELERDGQPMTLPAPQRASLAVLTSGPQRAAGGATTPPVPVVAPAGPPSSLPPLPARPLPPAGAAAPPQDAVAVAPQPPPGQPPAPPPTLQIQGLPPGSPPPQPAQ